MKLLVIFLILSSGVFAKSFEEKCIELNGRLEKGHKCPNTSFPLLTKVCFFENTYGDKHFTDGCTGPSGGHRDLFLPACIKHDLCYHHEPATSGKTQKQCDKEFLENLTTACQDAKNLKKCEGWAKTMYRALRIFGGLAYRCENSSVTDYWQYASNGQEF